MFYKSQQDWIGDNLINLMLQRFLYLILIYFMKYQLLAIVLLLFAKAQNNIQINQNQNIQTQATPPLQKPQIQHNVQSSVKKSYPLLSLQQLETKEISPPEQYGSLLGVNQPTTAPKDSNILRQFTQESINTQTIEQLNEQNNKPAVIQTVQQQTVSIIQENGKSLANTIQSLEFQTKIKQQYQPIQTNQQITQPYRVTEQPVIQNISPNIQNQVQSVQMKGDKQILKVDPNFIDDNHAPKNIEKYEFSQESLKSTETHKQTNNIVPSEALLEESTIQLPLKEQKQNIMVLKQINNNDQLTIKKSQLMPKQKQNQVNFKQTQQQLINNAQEQQNQHYLKKIQYFVPDYRQYFPSSKSLTDINLVPLKQTGVQKEIKLTEDQQKNLQQSKQPVNINKQQGLLNSQSKNNIKNEFDKQINLDSVLINTQDKLKVSEKREEDIIDKSLQKYSNPIENIQQTNYELRPQQLNKQQQVQTVQDSQILVNNLNLIEQSPPINQANDNQAINNIGYIQKYQETKKAQKNSDRGKLLDIQRQIISKPLIKQNLMNQKIKQIKQPIFNQQKTIELSNNIKANIENNKQSSVVAANNKQIQSYVKYIQAQFTPQIQQNQQYLKKIQSPAQDYRQYFPSRKSKIDINLVPPQEAASGKQIKMTNDQQKIVIKQALQPIITKLDIKSPSDDSQKPIINAKQQSKLFASPLPTTTQKNIRSKPLKKDDIQTIQSKQNQQIEINNQIKNKPIKSLPISNLLKDIKQNSLDKQTGVNKKNPQQQKISDQNAQKIQNLENQLKQLMSMFQKEKQKNNKQEIQKITQKNQGAKPVNIIPQQKQQNKQPPIKSSQLQNKIIQIPNSQHLGNIQKIDEIQPSVPIKSQINQLEKVAVKEGKGNVDEVASSKQKNELQTVQKRPIIQKTNILQQIPRIDINKKIFQQPNDKIIVQPTTKQITDRKTDKTNTDTNQADLAKTETIQIDIDQHQNKINQKSNKIQITPDKQNTDTAKVVLSNTKTDKNILNPPQQNPKKVQQTIPISSTQKVESNVPAINKQEQKSVPTKTLISQKQNKIQQQKGKNKQVEQRPYNAYESQSRKDKQLINKNKNKDHNSKEKKKKKTGLLRQQIGYQNQENSNSQKQKIKPKKHLKKIKKNVDSLNQQESSFDVLKAYRELQQHKKYSLKREAAKQIQKNQPHQQKIDIRIKQIKVSSTIITPKAIFLVLTALIIVVIVKAYRKKLASQQTNGTQAVQQYDNLQAGKQTGLQVADIIDQAQEH